MIVGESILLLKKYIEHKLLVIIQARTSSKRFRNKVLKKIYGETLISHIVNRLKKSNLISNVIVATSKEKSDDKLVKHLNDHKIKFFRGELNNVAKRFLDVLKKNKTKFFIRISGDSPLIDFRIIDLAIKIFRKYKYKPDIITNVFPRTFPVGQSVELIKSSIIRDNIHKFSNFEKEHVTKFFYNNSKKFIIRNFKFNGKKIPIKLSVDKKEDLITMMKKYNKKKFEKFKLLK